MASLEASERVHMLPYLYHTLWRSLDTNRMSMFDRRGARADQTNSPPEAPTNSLKPESRECE